MKNKYKLPLTCEFCQSTKVKYSEYYPSFWFCQSCKNGDELKEFYKETQEITKSDYSVEQPDPFTIIKRDKNGKIIDIIHWEI